MQEVTNFFERRQPVPRATAPLPFRDTLTPEVSYASGMCHLFLAWGLALGAPSAQGMERPMTDLPRTISVTGDAEVRTAPNEVLIHLGVESHGKELEKARKENDDRIKKIIAAAKSSGVDQKRIATDEVSIEPHYDSNRSWSSGRPALDGYTVRRSVQVTLREVAKFDAVLTAVLEAGANVVNGVHFTTTELRKYRDQARAMAMKAAQEKAIALAAEMGMRPGKPRTIHEGGGGVWGGYGYWGGRGHGFTQNVSQRAEGSAVEGTLAPGLVSVTASVSIVFDLE